MFVIFKLKRIDNRNKK